jgi:adenylate kinase
MNIIILGPQGSGKGTQASLLAQSLSLHHLETGKISRDLAKINPQVNDLINKKGGLIPDEVMLDLIKQHVDSKKIPPKDIIFDGYPRNLNQYNLLANWLATKGEKIDIVIFLDIPQKETVKRLSQRRIDKNTKKIYNLLTNPPNPKIKPQDLIQREDDKPDTIKKRLNLYYKSTLPLIRKLQKENVLVKIDGTQSIQKIHTKILSLLPSK